MMYGDSQIPSSGRNKFAQQNVARMKSVPELLRCTFFFVMPWLKIFAER
jgi:hypothetical protein